MSKIININIWLLNLAVILGGLSVFFDNNLFQAAGFAVALLITLINRSDLRGLILLFLLFILLLIFDDSGMGAKTAILLYLYISTKKKYPLFYKSVHVFKKHTKIIGLLFFISLPITVLQILGGEGNTGLFGLVRGSSFFWDPNYFVILLLALTNIYRTSYLFFLVYAILGQTLTSIVAFIVYKINPVINYLLLFAVILVYLIFDNMNFDGIDLGVWFNERIYSFSIRVQMLQSFLDGSGLDGAAPHMSFLSGFKKNSITTILFFICLPFIVRDLKILGMYLVISMTYDVFFGPLCFLIPFAINSKFNIKRSIQLRRN